MNRWMIMILVLAAGLIAAPRLVVAHEGHEGGRDPVAVVEETPAAETAGPVVEEAQRLRRLKQEDPEQFRRVVQGKKAKLRERLAHLKETDPEAYRRAMARLRERREHRLAWLREHRPEAYRRLMAQRRQRLEGRLEELRTRDPQRYEELVAKRREWRHEALEHRRDHREPGQGRREDLQRRQQKPASGHAPRGGGHRGGRR